MATQSRTKIHVTTPDAHPQVAPEAQTLEGRIRARAYELYEERGKAEGHEMEDWLQAETELLPLLANRA